MKRYCDLHAHTRYSDGTYTPQELVDLAEEIGLSAVALTDHNNVGGLTEFLKAGEGKKVETVAGVEFSTDYLDTELHILGLFIKPQDFDKITALFFDMGKRKEESNQLLAENLKKAGYDIEYAEVKVRTANGHVNRTHFAEVLMEKGYVSSIAEAFDGVLSKGNGFYVQPKRLDAFETISFIKSIGAVSVLAHSFLNLDEEGLRIFLPKAIELGLDGMETVYSTYDKETEEKARRIAKEFGLLESGGSDFHGTRKPDIRLGIGKGNLAVPEEFFQKLKERAK